MLRWVCVLLPLMGCDLFVGADGDPTDLPDPLTTARFTADAVLQDCYWGGERWIGVQALQLTLEHRSTGMDPRDLPSSGTCSTTVELYAEQVLKGGDAVPGMADRPGWSSPETAGRLPELVPGLWHGNAFSSPERCAPIEESVGQGVQLTSAGQLTGLSTPAAETYTSASADGLRFEEHEGVLFGDVVELAWEADGWDQTFVQVWREHDGEVREIITCAVQGSTFTIDDAVWSKANPALLADGNRVVVGLVREDEVLLDDRSAGVLLATRALHVLEPR